MGDQALERRREELAQLCHEYEEEDFNKFTELARRAQPAAILSEATGGQRERSARYRDVLASNGFENELRVTLMLDATPWGGAAFYRTPESPDFSPGQTRFVADAARYMAEGVRRAILIASVPTETTIDGPGLILLDPDDRVESITPAAGRWLAELVPGGTHHGGELPNVVYALVGRARSIAGERADDASTGALARARVRSSDGRWIVFHGTTLDDDRAAVILEPAQPPEIAPLVADAYGLSESERSVTQLVLQGLSTREIASTLHLSPYTVQDHLKAIFEKTGVRSRRELVAQVFFRHYAPHMGSAENVSSSGWFKRQAVPG